MESSFIKITDDLVKEISEINSENEAINYFLTTDKIVQRKKEVKEEMVSHKQVRALRR